jgi:23S rRNA pseudouridine2605 synthase
MERSGNRFNKSRSGAGKRSFEKGDSFKPEKKRFSKDDKKSGRDGDKPFSKRSDKPFRKKEDDGRGEKRSYGDKDKRSFGKSDGRGEKKFFKREGAGDDKRPFRKKDGDDKPFRKKYSDDEKRPFRKKYSDGDKPSFRKKDGDDKPFRKKYSDGDKPPFRKKEGDDKPFRKKYSDGDKPSFRKKSADDKPFRKKHSDGEGDGERSRTEARPYDKKFKSKDKPAYKKHYDKPEKHAAVKKYDGLTRLNKYLSNAGICSRREADDLIKAGAVSVNGKVITEMGYKVGPDDKVNYGGETLRNQKKVYLLLNKPKDYITTTDDPQERRTVMELIEGACKERVYPVGRLDRNTTGLLLFTNDGELATRLMHPKFGIRKVYQVTLNKNLKTEDFQDLMQGIELEDGLIKPDELTYIEGSKKDLGIEIHSGRNRIVRRMFEHIGYEVIKLDRVAFAGLTKKDLPRAKWRFLSEKEVGFLKMIG